MSRVVLLIALAAVGYDAYAHQGSYTRAAVGQVETGIQRLSAMAVDGAKTEPRSGPNTARSPAP